ncbi:MAG: hypothetical protein EOO70_00970 [Myxococcaceae bacterium]|nr:MAG: hypothetical protein EOO70_00970 [Myxococcaceae bacterium]
MTVGKAGDLMVNWVVPTPGKAYTNGPLLLQFTVEGGSAEAVEILKDASVLAKPTGTPFAYTWDTTQEAEGSYQLSVRAIRGGATFISAPRTVVVDRTAPTVSSFLPARNAAAVGVHESIQVTFSEPMNPRTLTDASVQVTASDSAPIDKSVNLSADGRTLTVTPINPLVAPNTLHVEFTNLVGLVITDLAGNEVVDMPAWSFSVPTWLPLGGAISAVPGNTSAEGVVLKMDRNDRPVVAWAESDGATKNIYVARWTGSAWSMLGAALNGLTAAGTNAANPSLVIDNSSAPLVAWDETTGNGAGRSIFISRWTGTTWESLPNPPFPSSSIAYPSNPQLTFDSSNSITIFTDFYDSTKFSTLGYMLPAQAQTWQAREPQENDYLFNPGGVSTTSSGLDTFIASSVFNDHHSTRGIAVFKNGDSYLGATTLGQNARNPSISADINGRPWVAWTEETNTPGVDSKIHWARWEGSAWTTPMAISTRATGNENPSLALARGSPHILAWSGIADSERSIFVSQWLNNSWQILDPPLSALTVAGTPAVNPSVDLNASAQPFIAWAESDTGAANIYAVRLNR